MRNLWLVFAQAVTATLAVIFVVSLVKPEWMARRSLGVAGRAGSRNRRGGLR